MSAKAPATPTRDLGVARVLDHVREPAEIERTPVVEFRNVTKTYGVDGPNPFTAIKDVTFAVADRPDHGEFVAVLGPSGCGKSTVLRLIAGLEPQHPATSGAVIVKGEPVSRPGADRGMVFQDYTSFDHRTVLDNVTFGLECAGVPRAEREARGRDWIGRVGLDVEKDIDKYPHELSGGMRQRVAIARTLILRPSIILMDEPFGALDPTTRMNMQDLLVGLWREVQATVFFVTHSIEEAVYLGDRVHLMSRSPGTILQEIEVDPPDRPALETQREAKFQETVYYIRDRIAQLEREPDVAMGKYIKAAFKNRWNLLAVGAGTVFAFLTGRPDVVLPVIMAGEIAYLALLGTHSKFQRAVNAEEAKEQRVSGAENAERALRRIRRALPAELLRQYEGLRERCVELRQIAIDLRHADPDGGPAPLEKLQMAGLDRLLWIYLRLLYTRHSLERFLEHTTRGSIEKDIARLETKLAGYAADETSLRRQKARAAIEDNLATSRSRLDNLDKASENHELVGLEIDRLENKIRSLSELAVNRQEPEYISSQVDSVASSMLQTEQTMNDLEFATGFGEMDESVPELLNRPPVRVVR